MSENDFELSLALAKLVQTVGRGNILVGGVVAEVNEDFTCDVTIGEATQFSVPIGVLVDDQASFYQIPVVGTPCLLLFRDGNINQPQLVMMQQVDQLLINCKTLVQFNGGELGGMVKVNDLVTRMNNIEQKYNDMVAKFNTHTHTGVTTGAGVSGTTLSQGTESSLTTRSQIENTKIQQ